MDLQLYQKMFQSSQPPLPSMTFNPSTFALSYQQQLYQQYLLLQQQQQQAMAQFNPLLFMSANQNLMGGLNHRQQPQQQRQYRQNAFRVAPPAFNHVPFASSCFNPPPSLPAAASPWMPTSSPSLTASSSSSDGSVKEEPGSPRDVFFRTLSFSLKEANRFYNNNSKAVTCWKNPFLYKTSLCKNYSNRTFCRFGANCWYAHGAHELRCIPESKELPDPAFITRYLSFLGLPAQALERMIQNAYRIAKSSPPSSPASTPSPTASSTSTCFFPSTRLSDSPIKAIATSTPNSSALALKPDDKFYSSFALHGWNDIESAINNAANGAGNEKSSDNVYQLFGNPW